MEEWARLLDFFNPKVSLDLCGESVFSKLGSEETYSYPSKKS
jgi:hypothetical protein